MLRPKAKVKNDLAVALINLLNSPTASLFPKCLNAVFAVANERKVTSIAIPAIGTGVFKFPLELCAAITAKVIKSNAGGTVQLVRICVNDEAVQSVFLAVLEAEGLR